MNSRFYLFPIFAVLAFPASSFCATPGASPDPLLGIMRKELNRAHAALASANPAPYFVSYSVVDHTAFGISGSQGALYNSTQARQRSADVAVRLGSPTFDNTHGQGRYSGLSTATIPVENDPDAIARVLWHLTDREYQKASGSPRDSGKSGNHGCRLGKAASGAGGRTLQRTSYALRPRGGGAIPRSAWPQAGGPAAARRRRGPDVHQENRAAHPAGISQ